MKDVSNETLTFEVSMVPKTDTTRYQHSANIEVAKNKRNMFKNDGQKDPKKGSRNDKHSVPKTNLKNDDKKASSPRLAERVGTPPGPKTVTRIYIYIYIHIYIYIYLKRFIFIEF